MKIIESQSSYQLTVVLTDAEAVLYREVFRRQRPVIIPEFGDKKFIVQDISPCYGGDVPQNSWRLLIRQVVRESKA